MSSIGPYSSYANPMHRALQTHQQSLKTIMERLATGKRINRASDDPSGMAAVTNMKVERLDTNKQIEGFERENLRLGATEGALSVVSEMLMELQSIVVQAANRDALDARELEALQIEASGIIKGINHLSNVTVYNGEQILQGYNAQRLGSAWGSVETIDEDGNPITVEKNFSLFDLSKGGDLNILSGDMELAQEVVESASSKISHVRASMGAKMRSNDHLIAAFMAESEGLSAEISRIEDTDYAVEIAALVRTQVLEQASIHSLQIGQQSAQSVLQLLGGAKAGAPGLIGR